MVFQQMVHRTNIEKILFVWSEKLLCLWRICLSRKQGSLKRKIGIFLLTLFPNFIFFLKKKLYKNSLEARQFEQSSNCFSQASYAISTATVRFKCIELNIEFGFVCTYNCTAIIIICNRTAPKFKLMLQNHRYLHQTLKYLTMNELVLSFKLKTSDTKHQTLSHLRQERIHPSLLIHGPV